MQVGDLVRAKPSIFEHIHPSERHETGWNFGFGVVVRIHPCRRHAYVTWCSVPEEDPERIHIGNLEVVCK